MIIADLMRSQLWKIEDTREKRRVFLERKEKNF